MSTNPLPPDSARNTHAALAAESTRLHREAQAVDNTLIRDTLATSVANLIDIATTTYPALSPEHFDIDIATVLYRHSDYVKIAAFITTKLPFKFGYYDLMQPYTLGNTCAEHVSGPFCNPDCPVSINYSCERVNYYLSERTEFTQPTGSPVFFTRDEDKPLSAITDAELIISTELPLPVREYLTAKGYINIEVEEDVSRSFRCPTPTPTPTTNPNPEA